MATEPLRADDPAQVGAYRLQARLGEGGMGQVFLGLSPGGRKVAVKVIRREFAGEPRFRSRFAAEVAAARRVGGFHTAQVVDADTEAAAPWLVTAFIPGRSLLDAIREDGPLDGRALHALGAGLAEGLTAIHGSGLVHRDLKPGNVIMTDDGPRIIDFGIARTDGRTALTTTGVAIGTYAYMSPEQIRADPAAPAGPPSDVFALGCLLTYAGTGHAAFHAEMIPALVHRILNDPPDLGGVPADLVPLLRACLAKDPAERPTMAQVLARLSGMPMPTRVGAPDVPPAAPQEPPARPAPPRGGGPYVRPWTALAGLGLAVATVACYFLAKVIGWNLDGFWLQSRAELAATGPGVYLALGVTGLVAAVLFVVVAVLRVHPLAVACSVLAVGLATAFSIGHEAPVNYPPLLTKAHSVCLMTAMAALMLAFDGVNRWLAARPAPGGLPGRLAIGLAECALMVGFWAVPLPRAVLALVRAIRFHDGFNAHLMVTVCVVAVLAIVTFRNGVVVTGRRTAAPAR